MWLTSDEAVRARAFSQQVCDRTPSLRAAWNNHQRAIYFYYGDDCQNAAFTYEIAAQEGGMYAALGPQDVEDLLWVLHHGRLDNAEKDAIRQKNEKNDAQKSEQALGRMGQESLHHGAASTMIERYSGRSCSCAAAAWA